MDLDKLRNAKNDKEEAERIQKEKEEAEKLTLKAKQDALIKQYVDKLTKPIIEPQINNITDKELDELLAKNIFEKDNESDSYILPIKMDLGLLRIEFDCSCPSESYYKKYPNTSARWIEEYISITYSVIYIFNERIRGISSGVSEEYHYGEYIFNDEEMKDPIYEDDDYHYGDIMDHSIIEWLTEALKATTKVKYLFDKEDRDVQSSQYRRYFNPFNEKNITDALIKRLEEYGLKILDIKTDESIDEDCESYFINYEIKFKNPLK